MKRKITTLLFTMALSSALSVSVMAADGEKTTGFYDIGTKQDVTINAFSGDSAVSVTEKNLDNDRALEKVYANSDRVEVTFAGATKDEHFGVILVDGKGLPTKDTAIYYINQETATGSSVAFNVYPALPETTKDMTLYISSSKKDFDLVSVPMSYAVNADTVVLPDYTPGDVNDDSEVDVFDVVLISQHITHGTELNEDAADVNNDGEVDVFDVVLVAQHITHGIEL